MITTFLLELRSVSLSATLFHVSGIHSLMKATLVTLLLSSFVITPVLAECGPEVPASSFYGYSSRDGNGRCKTLEEVEAQVHAAFSPTMEYAFWIPSTSRSLVR